MYCVQHLRPHSSSFSLCSLLILSQSESCIFNQNAISLHRPLTVLRTSIIFSVVRVRSAVSETKKLANLKLHGDNKNNYS